MLVELISLLTLLTLGLLTPGPDFLLVLKNAATGSKARAAGTVVGITAGLAIQMVVISIGLTVLTEGVQRGIQLGGAAFLSWLGIRAIAGMRAPGPEHASEGAHCEVGGAGRAFGEGLICNLTNPKAFLFFVSVAAQLVRTEAPAVIRVGFPVVVVVHGAVCWSLVAALVQSGPLAAALRRAQRWLPLAFGVVLLAFAGATAWHAMAP